MDSAGAEEPSRVSTAAGLTSISFVLSEGHEGREAPLGGHGAGWIGLDPFTPPSPGVWASLAHDDRKQSAAKRLTAERGRRIAHSCVEASRCPPVCPCVERLPVPAVAPVLPSHGFETLRPGVTAGGPGK